MATKKKLHLCIDRIVPLANKPAAMELAVKENANNEPNLPPTLTGVTMHPAKIALFAGKMWANGKTLGVHFMDGSTTQKQKVMHFAQLWSKYANINFDFTAGPTSEI